MKSTLKTLKLLADPTRLRIINVLNEESLSVAELQEILGMGQSRISTQLAQLRQEGVVEDARSGKNVFYTLSLAGDLHNVALKACEELPEAETDKKALQVKAIIKNSFDKAFEKYDAILSPTAPTTALKMGENLSDPLKMYLGDIYTVSVNLAGLPSMVVPCGFDSNGLPVGLQLTGKAFSENTLMNIAYSYQQETDFHLKKPVLKKEMEA